MFEPFTVLAIAGAFLLAGVVKGVIGLGLPTVSLALLVVLIDLPSAMALLLAPSLVTNLWQASMGGHTRPTLVRVWPFLVIATLMIWFGALVLTAVDHALLSMLLGGLLVVYAAVCLLGLQLSVPRAHETWLGVVCGGVNGVLTGMTGSFVFPGVMYLQALGLSRDALIQAMGMLFSVSTIGLAVVLQHHDYLTVDLGVISVLALAPALLGMSLGQWVRRSLSEQLFRRVFFMGILLLGSYIIVHAI